MKLTITTQTEQEVELVPPLFWKHKEDKKIFAFLDDQTVVNAACSSGYSYVSNGTPSMYNFKNIISDKGWQSCTESEWFDCYNAILQSISLTPILKP